MLHILTSWLVSALVIMVAAFVLPGVNLPADALESFRVALVVALIIGLFNAFVKPFLELVALPITVLTFGLFTFVINAVIIWVVAEYVVSGFDLANFWWAIAMALFVAIVGSLFARFNLIK